MTHAGAIVVGLGDEPDQHRELAWAAGEAQLRNRPLHVLRVYHLKQATVPWESSFDRTLTEQLRESAENRLAATGAPLAAEWPDVKVETFAVDGIPAAVLREASASAELTVLGSRQLGAIGSAVIGSVSTVVAAAGSGPVVVVRGPAGDPGERPQVVVGVDGSSATADVLDFAFDFASRHGRDLRAVFCWPPDALATMQWRGEPLPPDRAERWLAEAVAGWQDRYPDVSVHRAVARAHPVAGLVAEAQAQELLVVGAHSRHARLATVLGSVSQGVLHHATCPVAVVHPR